jgi:predicted nucleic acid-binding protein
VPARVLDSWAVLCYLRGEEGSATMLDMLETAAAGSDRLLLSVVNWAEVLSIVERTWGSAKACESEAVIGGLPIERVDVDEPLAREAARLKAHHPIAFADCFAAALARREKATIVTGDPEFRRLAKEVRVTWLT